MQLNDKQYDLIKRQINKVKQYDGNLYQKKFASLNTEDLVTQADFEAIPLQKRMSCGRSIPLAFRLCLTRKSSESTRPLVRQARRLSSLIQRETWRTGL